MFKFAKNEFDKIFYKMPAGFQINSNLLLTLNLIFHKKYFNNYYFINFSYLSVLDCPIIYDLVILLTFYISNLLLKCFWTSPKIFRNIFSNFVMFHYGSLFFNISSYLLLYKKLPELYI